MLQLQGQVNSPPSAAGTGMALHLPSILGFSRLTKKTSIFFYLFLFRVFRVNQKKEYLFWFIFYLEFSGLTKKTSPVSAAFYE